MTSLSNGHWLSQLVFVGTGGFLGAVGRYLVGGLVHRLLPFSDFPYGTMTVNLVGCLVIGSLGGLAESRQVIGPELRLFLFIGILGGFTTFSTFGFETMMLLRERETIRAMLNVGLHLVFGLTAVWLGYTVTRAL